MDRNKLNEKIAYIKSIDKYNLALFQTVATEKEVAAYEKQFDLKLPPDLRYFVTNVANGVYYLRFDDTIIAEIDFKTPYFQEKAFNPGINFPLTMRTRAAYGDDIEEDDVHIGGYPYETDNKPDYNWQDYTNGQETILGTGCGNSEFIVLKGEEYGNVWGDENASNKEFFPLFDREKNLSRINFEYWVNEQLDKLIASLNDAANDPDIEEELAEDRRRAEADEEEEDEYDDMEESEQPPSFFKRLINWLMF